MPRASSSLLLLLPWLLAAPLEAAPQELPDPASEEGFGRYTRTVPGTEVAFTMVPVPAGTFSFGSNPDDPLGREDERPPRRVAVDAFWMGRCEVTWDLYELWALGLDARRRSGEPTARDEKADGIARPTPPYTDMTFGMGHDRHPAICMTQHAAKTFCRWLSAKTGESYRLPTEAEWEYACRAGTTTPWSFGDDEDALADHAWYRANSQGRYHEVGQKKPNRFGLHDMHGNVAEWCRDQYVEDAHERLEDGARNPFFAPKTLYPRVVRGGSWRHGAADCRSAARMPSGEHWKMQDPQLPKSIWYHTDALFAGFRIVRPRREAPREER